MSSKTLICNQALFHLKNSKTLTDVDTDTSIQAIAFQTFYDDALDEMLEEYDWPFATRIEALALVKEDPNDGIEWKFSYRYPSGCLTARYIVDGNLKPSVHSPRIEFAIGSDDTGLLIFTNEEDASLCFTKRITDVTKMTACFRKALSYKLAALVAPTLCGEDRTGLGMKAQANYEREVVEAWAGALSERETGNPRESEFIEGR